jgi:hypothetical protein
MSTTLATTNNSSLTKPTLPSTILNQNCSTYSHKSIQPILPISRILMLTTVASIYSLLITRVIHPNHLLTFLLFRVPKCTQAVISSSPHTRSQSSKICNVPTLRQFRYRAAISEVQILWALILPLFNISLKHVQAWISCAQFLEFRKYSVLVTRKSKRQRRLSNY